MCARFLYAYAMRNIFGTCFLITCLCFKNILLFICTYNLNLKQIAKVVPEKDVKLKISTFNIKKVKIEFRAFQSIVPGIPIALESVVGWSKAYVWYSEDWGGVRNF